MNDLKKKKLLAAAMAAFFILPMSGCFKTEEDVIAEESANMSAETEEYHSVGETISTDSFDFTVRSIKYYVEDGAYFILADVTYTNKTSEKVNLEASSIMCYLDNEMAQQVTYSDTDYVDTNLMLNNSNINPGRTKSGLILYVSYRDWNAVEIQCNDVIVRSSMVLCESITTSSKSSGETAETSETDAEPLFIIDTSSGTFHRPECPQINSIGIAHLAESHNTAEVLISGGAAPCEVCRPQIDEGGLQQ